MIYKAILLLLLVPSFAKDCNQYSNENLKQLKAIELLIKKQQNPRAKQIPNLAPTLLRTAIENNLDPILFAKIGAVESNFNGTAYNSISHDIGLMQINEQTAKLLGVPTKCLWAWQCNLKVAAQLLANYKQRYSSREANWYCRYNVGTAKFSKVNLNCNIYVQKLARIGD